MRQLTIRSTAALAAVAIAAVVPTQLASAHSDARAQAAATTISVSGKEFSFKLSRKSISRPGTVTFSFHNAGHMQHNFQINHRKTRLISPGRTTRLAVTFRKRGRYSYICTVPGHAAAGMRGTFTVR